MKSRTNKAGQYANLVYDQERGFDPMRTLYYFADEHKLVEGRNPYRYFKGHPEVKFDSRKFREAIDTNPELQKILLDTCMEKLITFVGEKGIERGEDAKADMADYVTNILPEFFEESSENK